MMPQFLPGSREEAEFFERAKDPNSLEGQLIATQLRQNAEKAQQGMRAMLQKMIELVPGQCYRDLVLFHEKFGVTHTEDPYHRVEPDKLRFRGRFLLEELEEYLEAVDLAIASDEDGVLYIVGDGKEFDAEKALDALVDLVYVAVGTAYLHRFRFNEAWARVQAANMAKVRATSADDPRSKRKHAIDVVKPEGWKPPDHSDLMDVVCECGGILSGCAKCGEKGYHQRCP